MSDDVCEIPWSPPFCCSANGYLGFSVQNCGIVKVMGKAKVKFAFPLEQNNRPIRLKGVLEWQIQ